jgi:hypothetical protein
MWVRVKSRVLLVNDWCIKFEGGHRPDSHEVFFDF